MNTLRFEGKVFRGEGNGKKYLSLPWVKQQIQEKLGFTPFLGTLNLKLTQKSTARRKQLDKTKAIQIKPEKGYCVVLLFKSHVSKLTCAVVLPQVRDYPKDVLEVVAAVDLREALKLVDGDSVTVTVWA